jgi:hypothetical protein
MRGSSLVVATALLPLALCCVGCTDDFAQAMPPAPSGAAWSKSYGDELQQEANAVVVDVFGNVFVTGVFEGSIDLGGGAVTAAGGQDIFVAKYDTDGVYQWGTRYGDQSNQSGNGIALDPTGNVVVVGTVAGGAEFGGEFLQAQGSSDIFIARFSTDGEHQFSALYGGTGVEQPTDVVVDASGEVFICGVFNQDVDFGGGARTTVGGRDLFLVKLSPEGEWRWDLATGSVADEWVYGLAVGADGRVAFTGTSQGQLDFGGGPLPLPGTTPNDNAFLVSFSGNGQHQWSVGLGDDSSERGHGVAFSGTELLTIGSFSGNIDFGAGITRQSSGNFDIYVARYDSSGGALWAQSFGVSGEQQGYRVAPAKDGSILIAGDFREVVTFGGDQLTSAGEYDIYVARLDADGGHVASRSFGDELVQNVNDLASDSAGNAVIVGANFGVIDFGTEAHTSTGESDPFVAKLTP